MEKSIRWIPRFFRSVTFYPILGCVFNSLLSSRWFRSYYLERHQSQSRDGILKNINQLLGFAGLDDQLRVRFRSLEFQIVHGCNLHCQGCVTFSPFRKGFESHEQIVQWSQAWNSKLAPDYVTILGGEPLLHKDLAKIIRSINELWSKSKVRIVTNGMMLPKADRSVFDAIKETETEVEISKHYQSEDFDREFEHAVSFLDKANITYKIRPSYEYWRTIYQVNQTGEFYPFDSDPSKAWNDCNSKNSVTLMDNMLFKCSILAVVYKGCNTDILVDEWMKRYNYTPLTPDATQIEIHNHLYSEDIPVCSICTEKSVPLKIGDPRFRPEKNTVAEKKIADTPVKLI